MTRHVKLPPELGGAEVEAITDGDWPLYVYGKLVDVVNVPNVGWVAVPKSALTEVEPPLPPEPEPGCWRIGEVDAVRVPTVEGEYANPDGDDWFAPTLGKWYAWGALLDAASDRGNVAVKVASDPRYTMRPETPMPDARDIIDIAAQAMYTQDAQDSMSSCHWDDLSEGERDEWRRIAEAGIAALRDAKRLLPEHVNAVVVATTEAAEGFTERVEWGSLEHGEVVTWGIGGEKQARANAKWLRETDPDAKVMRRYVYIGPWEVASE